MPGKGDMEEEGPPPSVAVTENKSGGASKPSKTAQAQESELISKEDNWEHSLFGVLYTIGKEKYNENWKIALFNIIVDWLQVLMFVVSGNFGWNINYNSKIFKWLSRIQLQNPLVAQGYPVFAGIFYMGAALLMASLGLCFYVAHNFRTNNFPYVWPIKSLRFFVSIFLEAFFISSLNIFLIASDCNIFSGFTVVVKGVTVHKRKGYNDNFYNVKCFKPPHVIMFCFGILMPIVASTISFLLVTSSFELNLRTKNLQGAAQSSSEIKLWAVKALVTVFGILLSNHVNLQAVFLFISSSYLFYELLRRAPYLNWYMNCLRTALYAVLFWCSFMLLVLIYVKTINRAVVTQLMFGGSVALFAIGWVSSHYRQAIPRRIARRFKEAAPYFDAVEVKFFDDREVEVAGRCGRICTARGDPDKDWHAVAEAIYLRGLEQFPESAFLNLVYANFLFSIKRDFKAGNNQLALARKLRLSFTERFLVFVRDRERKQRSGTEHAGDSAMDLVSYVEFMNNFKAVLAAHTAALKAIRSFWRELLRQHVSFSALASGFHQMDQCEAKADKVYRSVLERYPKSVKLLKTYGRFLEDVKNDPWSAAKYFNEAERIEDIQAEAAREAIISTQGGDGEGLAMVDDTKDAVIVIAENGLIQFTNRVMNKMFGYKKGELDGKNVSTIMPNPFSAQHNQYLKNYKSTGRARILNRQRKVVALHKQRHVFPVMLVVTRIMQGETGAFMGVIKEVPDSANDATVYITTQGVVVCANQGFSEMFGWKGPELVGRNLRALTAEAESFERQLRTCSDIAEGMNEDAESAALKSSQSILKSRSSHPGGPNATQQSMDQTLEEDEQSHERVIYSFQMACRHKYGSSPFQIAASVTLAGTENVRLLVLHLRQVEVNAGVLAINENGLIQYCSASIEQIMLGNSAGYLTSGTMPLGKILPFPYTVMHQQFIDVWASNYQRSGMVSHRPVSCAAGRIVPLYARGGRLVPCHLRISMLKDGMKNIFSANVSRVAYQSQWEERFPPDEVLYHESRIRMLVRGDGVVLVSDAPAAPKTDQNPSMDRANSSVGASTARAPERSARANAFGYMRPDLEGANLLDIVDVLQEAVESAKLYAANATAAQVVPPFLKKLDNHSEFGGMFSWRVGFNPGPARRSMNVLPVLMTVSSKHIKDLSLDRMEEEGLILEGAQLQGYLDKAKGGADNELLYVIDFYRADMLQGVVELEKSGRVRRADKAFGLLVGRAPESMPTSFLMNLLANPPPQSRLAGALGLKPGKQVGDRTPVEFSFADGSVLGCEVILCARNEEATRIQALVHTVPQSAPDASAAYRRIHEVLQRPVKVVRPQTPEPADGGESAGGNRKLRFGDVPEKAAEPPATSVALSIMGLAAAKRFGRSLRKAIPSVIPEDEEPQSVASLAASFSAARGMRSPFARGALEAPSPGPGSARRPMSATGRPGPFDGPTPLASQDSGGGFSLYRNASYDAAALRSNDGDLMTYERMTSVCARSDLGDELTVDDDDMASNASSDPERTGTHASDFKRARRFRRLQRLLTSVKARRSQVQLTASARIAAILVLLVHIGVFITITMLVANHRTSINQLSLSGEVLMRLQSTIGSATLLASSLRPDGLLGSNVTGAAQYRISHDVKKMNDALEKTAITLVDKSGFAVSLKQLTISPTAAQLWFSLPQNLSGYNAAFQSTWDLTRDFLRHSTFLTLPPADITEGGLLEDTTAYRFVADMGATTLYTQLHDVLVTLSLPHVVESLRVINTATMTIYLIEGSVIIPLCALLMYVAVRNVMRTRISLFSTFLVVPKPMAMHLATRKIKLDEDDSEDEVDDDIEFERILAAEGEDKGEAKQDAVDAHNQALSGFSIVGAAKGRRKRKLELTRSREMIRLLSPFVFYTVLLMILSGITSILMKGSVAPLAALTEAETLYQLTARVQMFSEQLTASVQRGDAFSFTAENQALNETLAEARSTYRMVLLGNAAVQAEATSGGAAGASSAKTQSIIQKKKYQNLLFGMSCLRSKDAPPCPVPGSLYYDVTQRGLDTAWQAFLQAADALVTTPMGSLNRSNVNYLLVQELGTYDVRNGMATLKAMFESDNVSAHNVINILGICVFVIILIGSMIYLMASRPFIKMTAAESKRVAELLSLLPEEMDVEGLVVASGGIASEEKRATRRRRRRLVPWYIRWIFWLDFRVNGYSSPGYRILRDDRPSSDGEDSEEEEPAASSSPLIKMGKNKVAPLTSDEGGTATDDTDSKAE